MASRAALTKREKVVEKEAKIIAAARTIFLRKGVDGTRMSEIAKVADVAEGTLYLYFKNKEALLHAISGVHWTELTKGARAAIAESATAMDGLHALADYHMSIMIKDWPLIELSIALAGSSDAGHQAIFTAKREYASIFDALFTRGLDRGEFSSDAELWFMRDLFYGTLEYSARTISIHSRMEDSKIAVKGMMQVLNASLCPSTGPSTGPNTGGNDAASLAVETDLQAIAEKLLQTTDRLEKLADQETG